MEYGGVTGHAPTSGGGDMRAGEDPVQVRWSCPYMDRVQGSLWSGPGTCGDSGTIQCMLVFQQHALIWR